MKQKLKGWGQEHAELERAVASMKDSGDQDVDGRAAKAMLLMMPGFMRAMDQERALLAKTAKRSTSGRTHNTVEDLNDHLFVMVNAMSNMVIELIANAIPCDLKPVCHDCLETRLSLLCNVLSNVAALASSGIDRTETPQRFHS